MMNSYQQIPSASSIFSAYASISASAMLLRSAVNEFIPHPIRIYLQSTISRLFKQKSNKLTLIFEEGNEITRNQLYVAAELYLCTKISPNANRLKVAKYPKENHFTINFEKGEKMMDSHQGIELKWTYVCHDLDQNKGDHDHQYSNITTSKQQSQQFELSFDKEYKELIFDSYLPNVIAKSKAMRDDQKVLKLCTLANRSICGGIYWDTINLEHASTFDTLAMDPEMKKVIKDDLDRFVRRKEFYKRVGRAWKRGYLLYGPPGTGKSSLIAAMANYLKFDIYDLQLGNLMRDSDLRRVLLATGNRSILIIEDIDCSVEIPGHRKNKRSVDHQAGLNINHNNNSNNLNNSNINNNRTPEVQVQVQLTLSGLLNFIDGLWSSCGDERIIIFTTNHKERLDPALLRPGRMDMHIHMSYLTAQGFKTLASNYLNLKGQPEHRLFHDIQGLIETTNVSPAQVAEELMRSEDVDVALQGVVKLLKRKKMEDEEAKIIEDDANGCVESVIGPKRQKFGDTEAS